MPIAAQGREGLEAILIVGLNPYRLFDGSYQGFLELTGAQIASAIANARAYEDERRRAEANFQSVDLAAFTADLASIFRSAVEKAGLKLRVDCEPFHHPVYVDRE